MIEWHGPVSSSLRSVPCVYCQGEWFSCVHLSVASFSVQLHFLQVKVLLTSVMHCSLLPIRFVYTVLILLISLLFTAYCILFAEFSCWSVFDSFFSQILRLSNIV